MNRENSFFLKKTAVTILFVITAFPLSSPAQTNSSDREKNIDDTLNRMEADLDRISDASQENFYTGRQRVSEPLIRKRAIPAAAESTGRTSREEEMETVLRNVAVQVSMEYFINTGEQTFNVIDNDTGGRISRLAFPAEGGMPVIKGEVRFLPRVSLGGRYAYSELKDRTCTDEDWDLGLRWVSIDGGAPQQKYIDYQKFRQGSSARVEFYDLNLYYNLFVSGQENPDQRAIFPSADPLYDNLLLDRVYLDFLAGYQYYRGRYRMRDPVNEALYFLDDNWYYDTSLPDNWGLDSFYKIKYWGPRIGFRAVGSKGKVSTKLTFAYAQLRTKAYGWWNLRDYSFWQSGRKGYGLEFGIDTTYAFTRSFSAGLGFNFLGYYQKKMKESGIQPGYTYSDQDIVRDANSRNLGPTFILKYTW